MNNILKQIHKYYIYAVSNKKAILLGSSNSKTELRIKALKNLNLDTKERLKKYNGAFLYRIKLLNVEIEQFAEEKNSNIKMIGGPIVAIIERITIDTSDSNRIKLKSIKETLSGNKIYFSDIYLEKMNTINVETIDKIAFNFVHKKFNDDLFAVNTINE